VFSLVFSLVFLLAKDVANIKKLMAAQQQEDEQAQAVADEASGVRPLMRNKQTKKHKTNAIRHFFAKTGSGGGLELPRRTPDKQQGRQGNEQRHFSRKSLIYVGRNTFLVFSFLFFSCRSGGSLRAA
jgi:hypothetical protein